MESTTQFTASKCPSQEFLLAFCSGTLSKIDQESIDTHLTACGTCRASLDKLNHGVPVRSRALNSEQESTEASLLDTARDKIPGRLDDICETESWTSLPSRSFTAPDNCVPERIGPDLIADRLGQGGFANVYLASDPKTGRQVAIKVPRKLKGDEQVTEFLAEAQKASQLAHAGIVRVYDFDRLPEGGCYVVMNYIEGQSLQKAMESERFSFERTAQLCIAIADALEYVHQKGFVHRDIKPANILLDKEGRPFVADFGLAIHETVQHEYRNQRAGTWHYMSPELVQGKSEHLDGRSDVWSMGVILYELLTRQKPFPSKEKEVLEDQILYRAPKAPRSIDRRIPKELETICLRCLVKDVSNRSASAADVAESLRSFLQRGRRTRRIAIWATAALLGGAVISPLIGKYAFRSGNGVALLASKPVVVFGSPRPDPFYDAKQQVYSVRPSQFRWIATLHRRPAEPVRLRATVSLKDWVGSIGIAWQVHDLSQRPGENNRWLVAEFNRPNIIGKCRLVVQELTLSPGGVAGPSGIASREIAGPPGSTAEMDLAVDERVLKFSLGSEMLELAAPVESTNIHTWLEQGELTVALTGKGQTATFSKFALEPLLPVK